MGFDRQGAKFLKKVELRMSLCNSAIFEFCERIAFRAWSAALACTLLFAAQNRVEAQGAALNQRVLTRPMPIQRPWRSTPTTRQPSREATSSAAAARYAFDVRDGDGSHLFEFDHAGDLPIPRIQLRGWRRGFLFAPCPRGTEDALFGNGVVLPVTIRWARRVRMSI